MQVIYVKYHQTNTEQHNQGRTLSTSPGFFINIFQFSNSNCLHQQDSFRNDQKWIQNQIKVFANTSFKAKLAVFCKPNHPMWTWQCQVSRGIDDVSPELSDLGLCSSWLKESQVGVRCHHCHSREGAEGRAGRPLLFLGELTAIPLSEEELRSLQSPLPRGQEPAHGHPQALQPHQSLSQL